MKIKVMAINKRGKIWKRKKKKNDAYFNLLNTLKIATKKETTRQQATLLFAVRSAHCAARARRRGGGKLLLLLRRRRRLRARERSRRRCRCLTRRAGVARRGAAFRAAQQRCGYVGRSGVHPPSG